LPAEAQALGLKPGAEWKNGEPALDPIEDAAHVDQRRAGVGLFPLAQYVQMLREIYSPKRKDGS
jgi:hypothetical protein